MRIKISELYFVLGAGEISLIKELPKEGYMTSVEASLIADNLTKIGGQKSYVYSYDEIVDAIRRNKNLTREIE